MSRSPGHEGGVASAEEHRIAVLQSLTARLARLSTSAEVAGFVLEQAASEVGAASGSLCLTSSDRLELVAWSNYPDDVVASWQQMPRDASTPAGECLITRQPVYCGSLQALYERYPCFLDSPIVGDPSLACLPLQASDTGVLGVLVLGFSDPEAFSDSDRELLEALAAEAGAALERAQTREALIAARAAAESATTRLAYLADASERLAASLDLEETKATIAELAIPRVADRCLLYLVEESGEVSKHPLGELGPNELAVLGWRPVTLEDEHGPGAVIRSGEAHLRSVVSDEELAEVNLSTGQLGVLRRIGLGGMFVVALHARGQRIGALAFVDRLGRPFTSDERALAEELAARAAMAIDNARLFGRELHIAETLQRALLPDSLPEVEGTSLAARFRPGTAGIEVGGDWYDVVPLGGDRLLLAVGDVSGRGLSAARVMASLRHAIKAYALEGHSPARILTLLDGLIDITRDEHFATVLSAVLDVGSCRLVVANAGHPEPLVLRAGTARYVSTEVGSPLGIGSPPAAKRPSYAERQIELGAGATLLSFTDGLVERRGEHLGDGLARLAEVSNQAASRAGSLDSTAALERFVDEVIAAMSPAGAEDDTAALAVHLHAPST